MKIIVKRVVTSIDASFKIYADNNCVKVISFRPNAPEGDVYNEEKNRERAIDYARNFLNNQPSTTTIYENEI
jgi:hypothetical protein